MSSGVWGLIDRDEINGTIFVLIGATFTLMRLVVGGVVRFSSRGSGYVVFR